MVTPITVHPEDALIRHIHAFAHLFPSTTGFSHWVYRARFWCSNSNVSLS
ncbi:hypothetical protein RchiOBHm_Chr6g0308681 [Rosa chinensis]|uniref:Uncharacterized protein n=1 Tax=Rosa chinensis TaxID=74649 RepID=A0A2P6Q0N8_ROSCH|nr:hypothetical protein RchiOBHm_Chr6g0308681 [Rosa chinensis]